MSAKISRNTKSYNSAIVALFLGGIVTFGAEYCVQPIIPVFANTFALEPTTASLAVSCGTAGMAISMILIALFASTLPRKFVMTVALIIPSCLAVAMSISEQFNSILILRFIQGVLLAGFPAMAVAYISEEFDLKIVGAVTGIYIAGNSVGGLVGRIGLSYFTDVFDWRVALTILGCTYAIIGVAFFFILPKPKSNVSAGSSATLDEFIKLLHNAKLMKIYLIAALSLGIFVCTYNFMSYVFLAPPYSLTQTQVGLIYFLFLLGTLASAVMGRLSDKMGNKSTVLISLVIMFAGILISALSPFICKILGIALVTYGFFGTHSSACVWATKSDTANKARISAMYMFFYYIGASVIGTAGGKFLHLFGWYGIVGFLSMMMLINFFLIFKLTKVKELV